MAKILLTCKILFIYASTAKKEVLIEALRVSRMSVIPTTLEIRESL